ncbi:MAG: OstA family organic solvent tolerance protein [uncultured Sulfurovum sp.]|uniref:OstA family organic solvent tolerance protein n=1 Tax=uncultured Sulfurovum sp. TaxID=269237 RepID=A0A6S6RV94_9BACT|nr:MAG: OstA family organic solvent tolerance protein [uncultured Sulfurovum sp.]
MYYDIITEKIRETISMKRLLILYIFFYATRLMADIVDIKANHFYANDINNEAYFEGDAKIKQGSNEFNASKITVFFNDQKKAKKYIATGNVKFDLTEKTIHYVGQTDSVTYAPESSKYLFKGNVVLKDLTNNRIIKAESVSLDLKTGLADIKGKKKKPVHFRFEIEDRK